MSRLLNFYNAYVIIDRDGSGLPFFVIIEGDRIAYLYCADKEEFEEFRKAVNELEVRRDEP